MSERLVLRVFRYDDVERLRGLAMEAAAEMGGAIEWNQPGDPNNSDFRLGHFGGVHSAYLPYIPFTNADAKFFRIWRHRLACPSIELRMQEGHHWDYWLFVGDEIADKFSTCPQYWDGEETPQSYIDEQRGNPELLASLWRTPVERIERYFMQWGYVPDENGEYEDDYRFVLQGRAYPGDECEYGNLYQFIDVLRALGGGYPEQRHRLDLPGEAVC
jgi:hypothetical protein